MNSVACPLCSASVAAASLETHLRVELRYPSVLCLLCPLRFFDLGEAEEHFRGRFAKHRGEEVQIAQKTEREKEQRLADLIDQALGEAKSEQSTQSQVESHPAFEAPKERDESEVRTDAECQDQEPTEDKKKLEAREPIASALVTSGGASGEVADAPEASGPLEVAEGEAASDESLDLVDTSLLEESESATPESKEKSRTKCRLCSKMVPNILYSQKRHAALHHLKLPIYACTVCSFTSSSLQVCVIKKHVKINHQNQENAGTKLWNKMLDSKKEAISKATKNCFPDANVSMVSMIHLKKEIRQKSCEICGKSVRSNFRNTKNSYFVEHVTRHHWKIVLHSCKLCPFYTSTCWHKGGIRDHLKAAHKALPSTDTFHSAVEEHRDAIAHLVDQCFPPI